MFSYSLFRHVNTTKMYLHFGPFAGDTGLNLILNCLFYLYFPNEQKAQFRRNVSNDLIAFT